MEITVGTYTVEVLRLDLHSIQCTANTKCCLGSIINTLRFTMKAQYFQLFTN